jgi:hypothetical protein
MWHWSELSKNSWATRYSARLFTKPATIFNKQLSPVVHISVSEKSVFKRASRGCLLNRYGQIPMGPLGRKHARFVIHLVWQVVVFLIAMRMPTPVTADRPGGSESGNRSQNG